MRLVKTLIFLLISISVFAQTPSDYVQPMGYQHYSFPHQVNFGAGMVKKTHTSAYVEIGPLSNAARIAMLIRGISSSELAAVSGLQEGSFFYNKTIKRFGYYNGTGLRYFADTSDLSGYVNTDDFNDSLAAHWAAIQLRATQSALQDTAEAIRADFPKEEIDIFLAIGQSNMVGQGEDTASSPNPAPNTVYQYWNGSFQVVTNEIGTGIKSSLLPSFAIGYNNLTGKKICIVQTAVNGTGMMAASNVASGASSTLNWGEGGVLVDSSINRLDSAIAAIQAAGYIPNLRGVLMYQGETDALAINSSYITSQMYKDTLTTMISRYRNHYNSNLPFYPIQIGYRTGSSNTGFDSIQLVTRQVCDSNELKNKIVYSNSGEFVDSLFTVDAIHLNTKALNKVGTGAAINVYNHQGNNFQRDGFGNLIYRLGDVRVQNNLFAPTIIGGKTSTSTLSFKTTTGSAGSQNISFFQGSNGSVRSLYMPYSTSGAQVWEMNFGGNRGLVIVKSGTDDYTGFRFDRTGLGTFVMLVGSGTTLTGVADVQGSDFVIGQYVGNIRLGGTRTGSMGNTGLLIGTNERSVSVGSSVIADASSQFDVLSPTNATGSRPFPSLTASQQSAISSPADRLFVWNSDSSRLAVKTSAGWKYFTYTDDINLSKYNNQTGTTYTLQSSDAGKIVTLNNAGAITLTVPASLPAGFKCDIVQLGAGQVTITPSSTTVNNRQSFTKTKGQYSACTIIMYATDTFLTQGDME